MNCGACPDEDDLLALVDGTACGTDFVGHLDACPECRRRADELLQSVTGIRRLLSGAEEPSPARPKTLPGAIDKYVVMGRLPSAQGVESYRVLHRLVQADLRLDIAADPILPSGRSESHVSAVRRLMSIDHPHLGRVRDCGFFHGRLYLVADYAAAESLEQRRRRGSVPEPQAVRIVAGLADAWLALNEAGVHSGDFTLPGILLTAEAHPLWTDWGARSMLLPEAQSRSEPAIVARLRVLLVDLLEPLAEGQHDLAEIEPALARLRERRVASARLVRTIRGTLEQTGEAASTVDSFRRSLGQAPNLWQRMTARN